MNRLHEMYVPIQIRVCKWIHFIMPCQSQSYQLTFLVTFSLCRYKLAPFRSQDVRRAVETAAKKLPADKRQAVNHYLGHSADVNRKPQPQDIVDAAMLLDSLKG